MPYQLFKARINTNFNRIIKPFKNLTAFRDWTNQANLTISEQIAFSDNNLENGSASYQIATAKQMITIDIKLMQSTKLTTYCFDVFLVINYNVVSDEVKAICALYQQRLSELQKQYNGNWIIGDQDLTLSCLK